MVRSAAAALGSMIAFVLVGNPAGPVGADGSGPLETTSLLGRKLYALPDSDGSIRAAKTRLAADPRNVTLRLKLARAQAAKREYREAIATCADGIRYAPQNPDLYPEKGHRELGIREFKAGLADLNEAVR